MRKLLLFFAMLCVSIGTWADNYYITRDDQTWFSNVSDKTEQVVKINLVTPGTLGNAIDEIDQSNYQIMYIDTPSGSLNAADIAALSKVTVATLDLQDAFKADKSAFTFSNKNIKYLILPDGWTKEEVNTCAQAIAEENSNFCSAVSQDADGMSQISTVTHYYYTDNDNNQVEYSGTTYTENGQLKGTITETYNVDLEYKGSESLYTNTWAGDKKYDVGNLTVTDGKVTPASFDVKLTVAWYSDEARNSQVYPTASQISKDEGGYYWYGYDNVKAYLYPKFTYQDQANNWQWTEYTGETTLEGETYYGNITNPGSVSFDAKTYYIYTYTENNEEKTERFESEQTQKELTRNVVVDLTAEDREETSVLGASLVAYVNKPNTLYDTVMHTWFDQKSNNKIGDGINNHNQQFNKIKSLTISGNAVAHDWSGGPSQINFVDGHMVFDKAADELGGAAYAAVGGGTRSLTGTACDPTFKGAGVLYLDLRDVKIDDQYCEDLTLSMANILISEGSCVEVWLPAEGSGLKTIPADFGTNVIREICIPSNIETIRTRAFPSCDHIWTTMGDESWENKNTKYDNGAYSVIMADGSLSEQLTSTSVRTDEHFGFKPNHENYTYGTYTFGSKLKLIESNAFPNSRSNVKDVYVLNTTAPECHVDAFGRQMYNGNGGYSPEIIDGIITRECYVNNGRWLTMLHYPRETTDPQIQRYTDPTRDYSIATGLRDGKGATIYFPNHSEFLRAYNQGSYGYTWNAWDTERGDNNSILCGPMSQTAPWSAENQAAANDLYTAGKDSKYSSFYDVTLGGNSKPGDLVDYYKVNWDPSTYTYSEVAQGNLYPEGVDYRGWHQFILTAYAANTLLEEEPYRSYITDNEWWTICPEFDITYAEAIQLFGTPANWTASGVEKIPYVSKLKYVRRTYGYDGKNVIYLNFSNNLMVAPEVRNNATDQHGKLDGKGVMIQSSSMPEAGDVIMSAGVPYLIKPNLTASGGGFNRQFRVMSSVDYEKLSDEQKSSTSPRYIKSDVLYQKIKDAQEMSGLDQMAMVKSGTYTVPVFVSGRKNGEQHGYTVEDVEMDGSEPKTYTIATAPYEKSTEWNYTFVGTLYKSFLPHFCYFLGWDSANNCAKFYYHNGNFDKIDNEMRWANGTGVIVPIKQSDLEDGKFPYDVAEAEGKEPAQWKLQTTFSDDSFMKAGSPAKLYVMDFNTPDVISVGEATSIEAIESVKVGQQKEVYDLQGRKVTTMSKGIYIVGGKKYVVK